MNVRKLTTGNLTAGCIKPSNEYTISIAVEPPGSYLSEGKTNGKLQMALSTCTLPMSVWTLDVMKATRLLSGWVGNDAAQMNLPLS